MGASSPRKTTYRQMHQARIRTPARDPVLRLLYVGVALVLGNTGAGAWRRIFKLLKGAGLHLEQWQQETALAVAKRLLVASMACVVVWGLARSEAPEAADVRQLLVRLSGRQMKRGCEFTEPALLSGLWVLLSAVWLLEHHDPRDLIRMAQTVLPTRDPPEKPLKKAV